MHGTISIENIAFSRNCDIKTSKCEECHGRFYLVKLISNDSNTLRIEHSLLNSPIIIPGYRFHFRPTDLADKAHSYDSGLICKETVNTPLSPVEN